MGHLFSSQRLEAGVAWSEMGSGAEMVNVAVLGQSCPVRVVPSTGHSDPGAPTEKHCSEVVRLMSMQERQTHSCAL